MAAPSQSTPTSSTEPQPNPPFLSPQLASYFIAGGFAGAASRTVVSPLERLKIIQQVQPRNSDNQYKGVYRSLVRMFKEEGMRGFMRGNGINCLRIVPYSYVHHIMPKLTPLTLGAEQIRPKRLASGALAGICSVCSTYPLDLVRARLSIATASIPVSAASQAKLSSNNGAKVSLSSAYHTASSSVPLSELSIVGMTLKIVREEGGIRGLYRGLVATAFGVAPYVGINFAAYEFLRGVVTPPGKTGVARKLSCGALAGSISQTLTYPFDVLRRKMQVTGMKSSGLGIKYTGAIDALQGIVKTEGIRGLYRGLWPNLLKVAPSIATSFFCYELVKDYLVSRL
ncbi:mitochondrial carrier [Mycena rosella]|uniref:Mitochondrial carrier n=1 Tax=Mycena rosella TaxID=1033263 RepID=A0AAD7E0N4_MYCRO|nr:mitochondrial carrier [Mycena rosella]